MTEGLKKFDEISLLITHYNRSLSLERLLKDFEDKHICFNEIVVSDDCSRTEHLNHLEQLKDHYGFKLIKTEKNRGLANNINKGQRAVSSPFTLYIQEDFVPTELFCQSLINGLELIREDPKIDLIRFYAYHKHPYLKPVKNKFSEMEFHFWRCNFWQFYCYSDHPHLRRSNFPDKFGDYEEGLFSDRAEFKMVISFLQKKGKSLIHDDYQKIFTQENSALEPSQVPRKKFREWLQLTDFFLIKFIRAIYRNVKFRIDYLFL